MMITVTATDQIGKKLTQQNGILFVKFLYQLSNV